jgi:hypothetical protein
MPMKSRADTALVRETLALRRALLPLFARDGIDDERLDAAAGRSQRAWEVFLTCECCALPLAARLRTVDLLGRLPTAVQALIAQRETAELQRVLAARQLLEELDRVSADLAIPLVVLKGGALAAERERAPLDLGDVDVLLPSEVALDVWSALADRSWRLKSGGPMPVRPVQSDVNHLPGLVSPAGGLAVELHTSLDYGSGAPAPQTLPTRALENRRSLQRLIGSFGVVTTLRHSVIKHPHRRGHLRDLLLLQDTLVETVATVDEIDREIGTDRYAHELHDMLSQAHALASGKELRDTDATARFVAWKYAAYTNRRGVLGPLVPGWTGISYLPLERPAVRRFALEAQLRYAFAAVPLDSPFRAAARRDPARGGAARLAGAVGSAAARVVRTAYRTSLIALLTALGSHIRHRIEEMITA